MRGGLTLMAGVATGSALGVLRVALTAYLLGTHSQADSLAVALGPLDTFNSMLTNSMVFAFVPMLTTRAGAERLALFRKLRRGFAGVFSAITLLIDRGAVVDARACAGVGRAIFWTRGGDPAHPFPFHTAGGHRVHLFGVALHGTPLRARGVLSGGAERLHHCVRAVFWKALGVYAFAVGYTTAPPRNSPSSISPRGASARKRAAAACELRCARFWPSLPSSWLCRGPGAQHHVHARLGDASGSGMAAALDYCMRGVGVPMALLVNPISNSLLPEIARLRGLPRMRDALRLIDRTVALTALVVSGMRIRGAVPASGDHALLSTRQLHGRFDATGGGGVLGLGPSLAGWTLLEITGALAVRAEPSWPPVIAATIPVLSNVAVT